MSHADTPYWAENDELIQPCACRCVNHTQTPLIVAHISSSIGSFRLRQLVRNNSWPSEVSAFFTVARSSDAQVQAQLRAEASVYGDILQADFIESYDNLTRKTLAGLAYIARHCGQARFVLKVDDDVFVDWARLIERVKKTRALVRQFYCNINPSSEIERRESRRWWWWWWSPSNSKWRVPWWQFPGERHYPGMEMYLASASLISFTSGVGLGEKRTFLPLKPLKAPKHVNIKTD